jgi:hypothetical protein
MYICLCVSIDVQQQLRPELVKIEKEIRELMLYSKQLMENMQATEEFSEESQFLDDFRDMDIRDETL